MLVLTNEFVNDYEPFLFIQRAKDEGNLLFTEEDLKVKEMELLVKKYNLDTNGDVTDKPLALRYQKAIGKLENELCELEADMLKVSIFNTFQ